MVDKIVQNEKKILDHIYRYRITTLNVVNNYLFPEKSKQDVKKLYRSLRDKGLVKSASLHPHEHYYFLTEKASASVYRNKFKNVSGFLTEHQLLEKYSMLVFCCLQDVKRMKYTIDELQKNFPDLLSKNIPANNYFKDTNKGKPVIGWLKIDLGFNYERVAQRIYPILKKRLSNVSWSYIIQQGSFIITIATGWKSKAQKLREFIGDKDKFRQNIYNNLNRDFNFDLYKFEKIPIKVSVCEIPEIKPFVPKK